MFQNLSNGITYDFPIKCKFYRIPWNCKENHGRPWSSMDVHGLPYGHSWICTKFKLYWDFPIKFKFYRMPWNCHEKPWTSMVVLAKFGKILPNFAKLPKFGKILQNFAKFSQILENFINFHKFFKNCVSFSSKISKTFFELKSD